MVVRMRHGLLRWLLGAGLALWLGPVTAMAAPAEQRRARDASPLAAAVLVRYGSFASLETANDLVGRTLADNRAEVDLVAGGKQNGAVVDKLFDFVTGKEAFSPAPGAKPYIRPTYGVRVVIRHDASRERGFTVHTAFPFNRDPKGPKAPVQIPDAFERLVHGFYQLGADKVASPQAWVELSLQSLGRNQQQAVKRFLQELLGGNFGDAALREVWNSASPDYAFVDDRALRALLMMVRDSID
jgi:CDI toxin RNase A-like protein